MRTSETGEVFCPVCECEAGKRYLCDKCQTVTVESLRLTTGDDSLSPQGVPQSGCPGCDQSPTMAVGNHECGSWGVSFVSARATCPFCQSAIVKQPNNQTNEPPDNVKPVQLSPGNGRSRLRTQLIVGLSIAIVVILLIPGLILLAIFAQRSYPTNSNIEGHNPNGTNFLDDLKARGIDHLYVGGLATDYCVKHSVLDARRAGLEVTVLTDAIAGVEVNVGDSARASEEMRAAGARFAAQISEDQAPTHKL